VVAKYNYMLRTKLMDFYQNRALWWEVRNMRTLINSVFQVEGIWTRKVFLPPNHQVTKIHQFNILALVDFCVFVNWGQFFPATKTPGHEGTLKNLLTKRDWYIM
jgi:hypothetical protein